MALDFLTALWCVLGKLPLFTRQWTCKYQDLRQMFTAAVIAFIITTVLLGWEGRTEKCLVKYTNALWCFKWNNKVTVAKTRILIFLRPEKPFFLCLRFCVSSPSLQFITLVLLQTHYNSDSDWSFEYYFISENWKFHQLFQIFKVFGYLHDEQRVKDLDSFKLHV